MRSIDIYKQATAGYTLINYDEQHQLFYQKTQLTEHEAHELNYAFAIHGTSKRYVKDISRFNNKQKR